MGQEQQHRAERDSVLMRRLREGLGGRGGESCGIYHTFKGSLNFSTNEEGWPQFSPEPDTATHPLTFGGVMWGSVGMLLATADPETEGPTSASALLSGDLLLAVVFFH